MGMLIECGEPGSGNGGRGSPEIREQVRKLLDMYWGHRLGRANVPVSAEGLAELRGAKVAYRKGDERWVASLMPVRSGFVIFVNEKLERTENRLRMAICHEIGHTFFFSRDGVIPSRTANLIRRRSDCAFGRLERCSCQSMFWAMVRVSIACTHCLDWSSLPGALRFLSTSSPRE